MVPTPTSTLPRQCFLFLALQKQIVGLSGCQACERIIYLHSKSVLGPPSPGPKDSHTLSPHGGFLPLLIPTSSLTFQSISHYFLKLPSLHWCDG